MRLIDAIPALFMIALSAAIVLGTGGLAYWADITPGPRFLPLWLAGVGVLLSALFLLELSRGLAAPIEAPTRSELSRVAMTVAGLVGMALLAPLIGMVLAAAVFVAFLLLAVLRQRLLPSLLTVLVIAAGIELIFVRWLSVPLPGLPFSI
jgi:putative tricarboxylic transport membrane protein